MADNRDTYFMIKIFHEEISDVRFISFIFDSPIYQRATLEDCDYIVHHEIFWGQEGKVTDQSLKMISARYIAIDKKVIVFIVSDYEKKYKYYKNLILIRTSLKASLKRTNEFVMPYLWTGFTEPFAPIQIDHLPQVGFCGLGSSHRKKLLKAFANSDNVVSDFILRDKFWGGNPHDQEVIETFTNNLKSNAFIIAQRGKGNFSMRFFETLSAGRIPVLVNTDMSLPFEDVIDWQKHIVFEQDEKACVRRVVEVTQNGDYLKMQKDCHQIFQTYFSQLTFFEQLILQIKRQVQAKKGKYSYLRQIFGGR